MGRRGAFSSGAAWTASDLAGDPHAVPDKAQRVRRMFGAIAHRYDLNNRIHSFGRDQAWRRRAVALSGLRPGEAVLDAACGTGDLAQAFADAGAGRVVGVDFAEPMLEIARRKAARRPAARRPAYVHGDVTRLALGDASFDVVSIAFGIRNVDAPGRALGEFHRVLRPGGRLVILEFGQPAHPVLRVLDDWYRRAIMPVTATLIAGDRSGAYRYLPRSVSTFAGAESLAGMLAGAGFEKVTVTPMTFGVCMAYVGYRHAQVR